jgi:hypothetical protein
VWLQEIRADTYILQHINRFASAHTIRISLSSTPQMPPAIIKLDSSSSTLSSLRRLCIDDVFYGQGRPQRTVGFEHGALRGIEQLCIRYCILHHSFLAAFVAEGDCALTHLQFLCCHEFGWSMFFTLLRGSRHRLHRLTHLRLSGHAHNFEQTKKLRERLPALEDLTIAYGNNARAPISAFDYMSTKRVCMRSVYMGNSNYEPAHLARGLTTRQGNEWLRIDDMLVNNLSLASSTTTMIVRNCTVDWSTVASAMPATLRLLVLVNSHTPVNRTELNLHDREVWIFEEEETGSFADSFNMAAHVKGWQLFRNHHPDVHQFATRPMADDGISNPFINDLVLSNQDFN